MQPEQQRIMGYFIEEAKDHLNTIEQGLLQLPKTIEDPEWLNEVFRAAHSIKGGAAMLGLSPIQHASHKLEDCFKQLQDVRIDIDRDLESMFLHVFDALKALVELAEEGIEMDDDRALAVAAQVEPTIAELTTHVGELVQSSPRAKANPRRASAAAPRVEEEITETQDDITVPQEDSAKELIFRSDVPARLREMLHLFKQADELETREHLQAICRNLIQAGEQFDLPEWCHLVQTVSRAIANPQKTFHALATVTIKEIKQAQELVLAGRAEAIAVTPSLQDLLPDSPSAEAPVVSGERDRDRASPASPMAAPDGNPPIPSESRRQKTMSNQDASSRSESHGSRDRDNNHSGRDRTHGQKPTFQDGPEVGSAELNSLADLFEGESPELDDRWESEEVLNEAATTEPSDSTILPSDDFLNNDFEDFDDLLSEFKGHPGASEASPSERLSSGDAARTPADASADNDDLTSLFGENFLDLDDSHLTDTNEPQVNDNNDFDALFGGDESNGPETPSPGPNVESPTTELNDLEELFDDSEDDWESLWEQSSEQTTPETLELEPEPRAENAPIPEPSAPPLELEDEEEPLFFDSEDSDFSDLLEIGNDNDDAFANSVEPAASVRDSSADTEELESLFGEPGAEAIDLSPPSAAPEAPAAEEDGDLAELFGEGGAALFDEGTTDSSDSSEDWLNFEDEDATADDASGAPSEGFAALDGLFDSIPEDDIPEELIFEDTAEPSAEDAAAIAPPEAASDDFDFPELASEGDDFDEFLDFSGAESAESSLEADLFGEESDEDASFEALLDFGEEPAAESPLASDEDDFDALFGDLEPLGGDLDSSETGTSVLSDSELEDLEALLADEEPSAPAATQAPQSGGRVASGEKNRPFADLEVLLNYGPPVESFDQLASLLEPTPSTGETGDRDTAAASARPAQTAPAASRSASQASAETDDFADLDELLAGSEVMSPHGGGGGGRQLTPRTRAFEQTMRVPVRQLDNLTNLVGELVVNRNSLEQDQERMRQFLDNMVHQVQQLSDVGQRMQDLYERSLLEISLLASRQSYHFAGANHDNDDRGSDNNWNALEMDRFTPFHTLSQDIIELIVRVRESASDIEFLVDETEQVTRQLRQVTNQLQEGLTRARMVPFSQTADRLPRGVRDNAIKFGKQVELQVEGRETLIDKMILEQLYDPMTHLVNNALAHGIETPDERERRHKTPVGRITIRAFHQGNQTVISVSDDGAGIDPEKVKAKALQRKLITPEIAKTMSRIDVYDLLFMPGFTTKEQADDLAGRGVGMDVVRTRLSEIRGAVSIDSNLGKGTTFTIRLPLTLSISKALCCISDRARIAFPMDGVEDMLDVPRDRIQTRDNDLTFIPWRDTMLPFRHLRELLIYNRHLSRGNVYGSNAEDDIISVVVLRSAGNYLALQVDQVLGEQEIVIKQLEGPVPKPVGVAGATVMGDGRIVAIADVLELIELSAGRLRRESSSSLWDDSEAEGQPESVVESTEPTVLIVDDSITVRELLSMTFNKAGYRVEQARDGQEAWEKMRSGLPCDIVFCDIEMPRMDGLELLSRMQKDPQLSSLPIAMLTSRGADKHRQMAVSMGASGYFTKPYLEESLLEAAGRMLKGEKLVEAKA
jgi:chemosensory pili system protein ChpA (sensor histidine kinase/response regulator)